MKTRAELDTMLDALEAQLPELRERCPDHGDFWAEFAGQADQIEHAAGNGADCAYVHERIDAMVEVIEAGIRA